MTTTWSPQSTCGVKLGLCLARRVLAMIVATRPTTRPSASIRCHFFSTSAGLIDLVVFISAFMGWTSSQKCGRRRERATPSGGLMLMDGQKVKQKRDFADG